MRVLYLGANPRTRLSKPRAPELRALGLKKSLEQNGVEFFPFMEGDKVNSERTQNLYSKQLKRILPRYIHATLRDIYEIFLDRRFYRVIEKYLLEIKPDIILQQHARYAQVGIRLGHQYNIPVFLDDITPIWEEEEYSDRSLKQIARRIRKEVFSKATGLIAVSRDMEIRLRSEGIPRTKIHLVPNGVDCTLFNPDTTSLELRDKYGLADKIVVGYVGSFTYWHRLDLLIPVVSSIIETIPQICFMLVGADLDGRMESMIRAHGLTNWFILPGGVPNSEVPMYLNAIDIAILPRTLPYMSPMKIYEYMAMGKPVVAPNKNALVEEVVIPYKYGLLFEAENTDSMKNAIQILAINPELRQKIGKDARKCAVNNYSWSTQARNLLMAFESALAISTKQ
jgi:glycosyltransferase involved in cell wall biosynthesis